MFLEKNETHQSIIGKSFLVLKMKQIVL